MKRSGFTLIEVMVVLSILAIIAILGYNFFGSTVREAKNKQLVTNVMRQFEMYSQAAEMYRIKTGDDLLTNAWSYPADIADKLVTGGLNSPAPNPFENKATNVGISYYYGTPGFNFADTPSTTFEAMMFADYMNAEQCKMFNEMYSSYGATIVSQTGNGDGGSPWGIGAKEQAVCLDFSGAANCADNAWDCSAIYVIDRN